MIKADRSYNKDFVFSITLTELIIMLFFLLLLLTAIITIEKNNKIENLTQEKKQLVDENFQKENEIFILENKNKIQKDVAIQIANEILNYQKAGKKNNSKSIKSFFKELVEQKELELENALLKKQIENEKLKKSIVTTNKKLQKELEIKKQLLENLTDANSSDKLKKLLQEIEKIEQNNIKLKHKVSSLKDQNKQLAAKVKKLKETLKVTNEISNAIHGNKELVEELKNLKNPLEIKEFVSKCIEHKKNNDLIHLNKEMEYKSDILKGQVQYLTRRLNMNGGNELPPCWANKKTGKPEYIFHVYINESSLSISPAWPDYRKKEVSEFKNINRVLKNKISLQKFLLYSKEIYLDSVKKECKYFVQLFDRAITKDGYKMKRLHIENYFYKYENK